MSVTTTFLGRAAVVRIQGRLDRHRCSDLGSALDDLVSQEHDPVVVDLGEAEALDSSAIGLMVRAWKVGKRCGVRVRLARPQEPVRRILELTGLAGLIRVYATIEDACDADE